MVFSAFSNGFQKSLPRYVPLLLLAGLCGPPAAAQRAPTPPLPVAADSSARAAREDTTYALQRLYHENRRRYRIYTILSGAGLGLASTRVALTSYQPGFTEAKLSSGIGIAGFAVFFTRSVLLLYSYRTGHEKKLIAAMQRGIALPRQVRAALKPSYFDMQTSSE